MKEPRPMSGKTLTDDQRDGITCVVCGALPAASVPVGVIDGGQVFACLPCADS